MDNMTTSNTNQTGWLRKHWKLVTLVGLGFATLAVAFVALVFAILFGSMKHSGAYELALSDARATPAVVTQIGEDLKGGWFITGNINASGPSGHAELAIPLSGTRGRGTLYTVADKEAGEWKMCSLVFKPDMAGAKVVIVDSSVTHCPSRSSHD
jgi:hypothetical protein